MTWNRVWKKCLPWVQQCYHGFVLIEVYIFASRTDGRTSRPICYGLQYDLKTIGVYLIRTKLRSTYYCRCSVWEFGEMFVLRWHEWLKKFLIHTKSVNTCELPSQQSQQWSHHTALNDILDWITPSDRSQSRYWNVWDLYGSGDFSSNRFKIAH